MDSGTGFEVRWLLAGGRRSAPAPMAIGALRCLYRATLRPGEIWPIHIHEELQAITYVVAGSLELADSLGKHALLTAGGVQQRWLGWGVEHQDRNPSTTEPTEFLQLWLRGPRAGHDGAVRHHALADRLERWLPIVRPDGKRGRTHTVIGCPRVYVTRLDPSSGMPAEYRFDSGRGGYLYVIEGDVAVNLEHLGTADAACVLGTGRLRIQPFQPSELLLVDVSL